MPWWGWALALWPIIGLVAGLLIGRAIRLADQREGELDPGSTVDEFPTRSVGGRPGEGDSDVPILPIESGSGQA